MPAHSGAVFCRGRPWWDSLLALVIGALVGLAGWFAPTAIGGGHALAGNVVLGAIPLWFAARFGLTMIRYGTGAPGGIFAPLLVACFCAYAAAESLRNLPIYEALLERDLKRGGTDNALSAPIVVELEVKPRSPFAGKALHELGLPPGCIVIRCREGAHEWVPTAQTTLRPHMRISAVIAPDASEGLHLLRAGCDPGD